MVRGLRFVHAAWWVALVIVAVSESPLPAQVVLETEPVPQPVQESEPDTPETAPDPQPPTLQDDGAQQDDESANPDDGEAAQDEESASEPKRPKGYSFNVEFRHDATSVKNQGATGTCWSFATASFFESELLREDKGEYDLSEMFIVRNIYMDKAFNYVHRNGKANFSEGALAHDFIRAAARHGLVPEEVYDGRDENTPDHDHGEMVALLEGMLKGIVDRGTLSPKWKVAFGKVLDTYLGSAPEHFDVDGTPYTPRSFAEMLEFSEDDYIGVTSFNHHPFGRPCVLEIPDNFSSGSFLNVPIDELVEIVDRAVENGYTIAWDGDVSEWGFNRNAGLAILPQNRRRDAFMVPGEELAVTQEMRQATFESHSLTDDHLMHLVGRATDPNGTRYYIIKNSWGETGKHGGYLYMSEPYLRAKTIAITVHRDSLAEKEVLHATGS